MPAIADAPIKPFDWVESKTVAALIRKKLKEAFPGFKFSVRSDHNSVDIRYTDGPAFALVNDLVQKYRGGGFDGMIDLEYSNTSYLLPDGDIVPANSRGTGGSGGSEPGFQTEKPHPDAIEVRLASKYVFTNRYNSRAFLEKVGAEFSKKYGHPVPPIDGDDPYAYFQLDSVFPDHHERLSYERILREMVCQTSEVK